MITHLLSSSGYFGFKGAFSKEWRQNRENRQNDVIMTSLWRQNAILRKKWMTFSNCSQSLLQDRSIQIFSYLVYLGSKGTFSKKMTSK